MQRNDLYIGIPEQQSEILNSLQSAILERQPGIHLVSGGIRSGKTSIVKEFRKNMGYTTLPLPMSVGYEQTLREYEFLVEHGAKTGSDIFITTTEIPDTNQEGLKALHYIVDSEIKKGNTIRVVGDIVTKRFPAWNSKRNNEHIAAILKAIFEPKVPNLYPLDSDPKRLVEGVWKMMQTENPQIWGGTAEELGLPSPYSEFWQKLPTSESDFVKTLLEIIIQNPLGNLEGQNTRGKERSIF